MKQVSLIDTAAKIFVAGHQGMLGSALVRNLESRGFKHLVKVPRSQVDLQNQAAVEEFIKAQRPEVVLIAAARAGGIHANNTLRSEFILDNLEIATNIIRAAARYDVKRLIFFGSSCIYPRGAAQPIHESALLSGPLEHTNRPYAIAKIAGLEAVNALRIQQGRDFFSVMPTNLYGVNDRYNGENAHVIPALIMRFFQAAQEQQQEVTVWGSGKPRREFMDADDCADAAVHLLLHLSKDDLDRSMLGKQGLSHINVGSGEEISIEELAALIASKCGYHGRIRFDTSKPGGTPRKLLDCSFLQLTGWVPRIPLGVGLDRAIADYAKERKSSKF